MTSIIPLIDTKKVPRKIRPATNPRLRNSVGSTTGWLLRRSLRTKSPKSTAESTISAKVHAGQPSSRPCTSG